MEQIINKHERIALQFSGGKDSLALLNLMEPYWDRLTVYWTNPGDPFPETVALMEQIRAIVPHFVVIEGDVHGSIQNFGLPSDLVPADSTPIGLAARRGGTRIQDRYSCCMRSLMLPMHERMKADGVTLVIRGQKNSDVLRAPIKSGTVEDGIEYLFPLEDWDDARVMAYLAEKGIPVPRFYDYMNANPDCMHCSAYWEEGRGKYLREFYPESYQDYLDRLGAISDATAAPIANFNVEIG